MPTLYIDADACPMKDECYRVAGRYSVRVVVCAKATMRVPLNELIQLQVCPGYEEVDDWISQQAGRGDIVVTSDIPLASRCLLKDALVINPKGYAYTENTIADALAMREIRDYQRQEGNPSGGPSAIGPKDRSKFLATLDELVNRVLRMGR
jgi:uncharacterized protein YaiI (UPF0178 family)